MKKKTPELDELLAKFSRGLCTPEEKILLSRWLNKLEEDPAGLSSEQSYEALKARLLEKINSRIDASAPEDPSAFPVRRLYPGRWAAVAASILLLLSVSWFFWQRQYAVPEEKYLVHHAGQGELKRLMLPDSSVIRLHAGSTIRFPERFDRASREIYLEGEAVFEVTRHTQHPFIVHAGKLSTRVLGTRFLVKSYPGLQNVEVRVAEGRVRVKDTTDQVLAVLLENESMAYDKLQGKVVKSKGDNSHILSGRIYFKGVSFRELALRIQHNYGYTLKAGGSKLENSRFTGDFSVREPLHVLMDKLCAIYGNTYEIKGKEVIMR